MQENITGIATLMAYLILSSLVSIFIGSSSQFMQSLYRRF